MADGSIVIPSYAKLAVGRPGSFRLISALNGNPGAINAVATSDGTIWVNPGNGLFAFPTRLRMEFWTEREGLGGNTWSILRTPQQTFALAGDEVTVLSADRRSWSSLAIGQSVDHFIGSFKGGFLASTLRNGTLRLSGEGKVMGKVGLPAEATSLAGVKADPQSGLWTCSGGVLVHKTGGWNPIPADAGSPSPACYYLAIDGLGGVWYGDANWLGAGFGLVEGRSGDHPKARRFTSGDEVGNATVRFLGVDSRGWIWRGSPAGVYVADPAQARQGQWLYLNRLDGIAGTDANRTSFFSDSDGSVWFGLDNSINHLYPPADFLHPSYAPSIFISGFSWNGGEFHMADMVSSIESRATVTAHIGSLQFDRRNALRLRYRLLPEQTGWRETKSLDLPLGVLSSGSHTLEVQGRIFTGPWSSTVRRSFSVLPPIWLTGRFFLFYFLAAAVLLPSIRLLRRKRQWEEQNLLPDLGEWRLSALNPDGHELTGAVLDNRFEVGNLLARGGFASVMAGFDRNKQRRCAIKIFRGELKDKTSVLRGFEQEVAALRQIHHPNIVSIYADGLTPSGAPYLAMEFVEGKNLRDILKDGPLPSVRAARLLEQLANALDAIHERGICHRDVKPENVIVRSNGAVQEEAVLIDFSIAIIKDANETLYGLSRAAGTFDYMAPEQAMGHAQPASDIFSLAKVTIELLTGARVSVLLPNAALDLPLQAAEMLKKRNLNLTSDSVFMLASALEFDPSRRPNVASQFAKPIVRDLIISNQNTL
jgi:predicted Ser/Thr protein kinase